MTTKKAAKKHSAKTISDAKLIGAKLPAFRKGSYSKALKSQSKAYEKMDAARAGTRKVSRSAETGKIVSKETAKKNPRTTVTETVKVDVKPQPKGKVKIPKSLPAVVDRYDEVRETRLKIQKQADVFKEEEGVLRDHLINNISKSDAAGVTGKLKRVNVVTQDIPRVEDEKKFLAYANKKGNEDLVKIVPNIEAIQARMDDGKKIPGIGTFTIVKLSLKKI